MEDPGRRFRSEPETRAPTLLRKRRGAVPWVHSLGPQPTMCAPGSPFLDSSDPTS